MKKLFFLLVSATFFSCSNNDNNNSVISQSNIINKWHLTSIIENGFTYVGTYYTCNTNFDITEFTSDGTSITKYSSNSVNCTQYTDYGKYTIVNGILEDIQKNSNNVIVYDAKYKITELTATTLKMSLLYLFEGNGTSSHTTNYLEGQEVRVYTKI